jgi:hypothetical protein
MSTQRRESHSTPTTGDCWIGALRNWRSLSDTACAENGEQLEVARTALESSLLAKALERFRFTHGIAETAPQWETTNSLQLESCTLRYVVLFAQEDRHGSHPVGDAGRAASSLIASRRSVLPLISHPPVLASLHPALPQFPAAKGSRTERYDGKRDLHLQHAA